MVPKQEQGSETTRGDLLYEGKAKRLFHSTDPGLLWVEYLDQATAFDGQKKDQIEGKGALNAEISGKLFEYLQSRDVPNHYVKSISDKEHLVQKVEIIPLEVVVRNVAAGSLTKRLGLAEGEELPRPIVEFYYKNDELGDPMLNREHIGIMGLATMEELPEIRRQAMIVNQELQELFAKVGVRLIDFKLEFGRDQQGQILLADEISPDNCRLWDKDTGEKLDKDVYRQGLGDLVAVYRRFADQLNLALATS